MTKHKHYTGFAIAIAWPETYCKQSNSWYDALMDLLGISKNYYYKVGHAALVLINSNLPKAHYFDFGRYHSPYQYGRVRSEITDYGLEIKTVVKLLENQSKIENLPEILNELQLNAECHGEGKLYASYCRINIEKALKKIHQLQTDSPISYGPFQYKGSNCSRFVNDVILAGNPPQKNRFKLKYFVPLTPTPLNNVAALENQISLPKLLTNIPFNPSQSITRKFLKTTLPQPVQNNKIPPSAQWLSGEGAGSWFYIKQHHVNYLISRYNQDGIVECQGIFELRNNILFDINSAFKFDYLSHCNEVVIKQNGISIVFIRI